MHVLTPVLAEKDNYATIDNDNQYPSRRFSVVSHQESPPFTLFDQWSIGPYGRVFASCEYDWLMPTLDHFRPYQTLLLGPVCSANAYGTGLVVHASHGVVGIRKPDVLIDYEHLPFDDHTFDLVVCPHVHESVADLDVFFTQVSRVLAPEGLLVVFSINPFGLLRLGDIARMESSFVWMHQSFHQSVLVNYLACHALEFAISDYGMHQLHPSGRHLPKLPLWLPSLGGVYKLVLRKRHYHAVMVGHVHEADVPIGV